MAKVNVNANFHTVGGKSVLRSKDPRFLEYRKNWEERPKNFIAGEFPLHLDIEASGFCNLKCPFCAMRQKPIDCGPQSFMSLETFEKVIDEGSKHGLCAIKLNSCERGEPLLNKLLPEMIAYAKEKGIMDVYFNTNAVLLTHDIGKKLIESGLDRISISFEGIDPEFYEKSRIGASFNNVIKNIKDFVQLRNEMGAEKPLIRVQTVALPEIAPKLNEYKEFWEKIADEVSFIDFRNYSKTQVSLTADWVCPFLWQRMLITWDGTISFCQLDYFNSLNLGNINKRDSIRDAWKSEAMEKVRELYKTGKSHQINLCNNCDIRATEIIKIKEKNI